MSLTRRVTCFIAKEIARQLRAGGLDQLLQLQKVAQAAEVVASFSGSGTLSARIEVVPTVTATAVVLAPVPAGVMSAMWGALPNAADLMEKRPDDAMLTLRKVLVLVGLLALAMQAWQTFQPAPPSPTQIHDVFIEHYIENYGEINGLDTMSDRSV